jgi:ubiquitin-like 1-activating enzyme E1 A
MITEREAEVYDRQIRLWGVEAQRRMKSATVLICGLTALSAEVTKNIVLSGISVALLDASIVTEEDLGANFFVSLADVGKQVRLVRCPRSSADLSTRVTCSARKQPYPRYAT